jgi:predicted nucleic-acid-binding protein
MKMTADTKVLVRALIGDDERQSKIAQMELKKAELVALALPALKATKFHQARSRKQSGA